jgi:CxxC motif-containing protein
VENLRGKGKETNKKQQPKNITTTTTTANTSSTSTPPTTRELKGMIIEKTTKSNSTEQSAPIKMGDIIQFQNLLRAITNSYLCKFKVHKGNCNCTCIKNLMQSVNVDIEKSLSFI